MKKYSYKINGADYDVTIQSISGQRAKVEVNGIPFDVEMQGSTLTEDNLPDTEVAEASAQPKAVVQEEAPKAQVEAAPAGAAGSGTPVKAPLPGVVTKINVSTGQKVKRGQPVLVLEAMKMENNITAEQDGEVTGICVKPGDSVLEGTVLLTIG